MAPLQEKDKQKRALITGASSGIGKEFAQQLAASGYAITAIARREEKLEELLAELPGEGHRYLLADLANADAVNNIAQEISGLRYHLLINNAGSSVLEPFYESELGVQQGILNTNCGATVTLAHAFLRQAQKGDALINLASVVSYLPTPAQPMYSASKAFVAAFSECLWEEQRERGVYVMGLCPGVTQTEFISKATGGESDGNTLPAALTQSTKQVVEEGLAALQARKKAIVITGHPNRLMMLIPRLLTRHRLIKVLAVMGDPDRAL